MASSLVFTPLEDIEKAHRELRAGFNSGKTKSIAYRKYQLLQLAYLVKDNGKRLEEAMAADLGRPPNESGFLEVGGTIAEIMTAYNGVDKWAKPEKTPFSLQSSFLNPIIRKEPKGVVLIIGPFNYPIWTTFGPLAGALAAGNAVLIKPSEQTPAVSSLIAELIPKYLGSELLRVVNGAIPETIKILELQWDHILFTGSGRVGKVVAEAAAKFLTPVTLELGGKSPVFIDPKCDMELTAKRLLWGKIANAGQTCVAPDYVLVEKANEEAFVQAMKKTYEEFYPPDAPVSKPYSMGRLVTPAAFARVNKLLKETKGTIVFGGETDAEQKFIAPTLVRDVKPDDSLMSEEIFGPLLPVMTVENVDEAIAFVRSRDHPLALYVFSQDAAYKAKVFDNTQSGAAIANETIIYCGMENLPFGGIGPSGSGYHTGKFSFDIFTHQRASLDAPKWVDKLLGGRYPPYTAKKAAQMARILPSIPTRPTGPPSSTGHSQPWNKWVVLSVALALAGFIAKLQSIPGLKTLVGFGSS